MKAAWKINLVCLTLLISAAVPPDSPVADAAMRGDAEEVHALLRAGADVNAAQGDGMTALHWAAENGRIELAEVLVFAGANPEAATRLGGFTPLMVASRAGHAGIVRLLADAGANLEATTETGETALHYAAWSGNPGDRGGAGGEGRRGQRAGVRQRADAAHVRRRLRPHRGGAHAAGGRARTPPSGPTSSTTRPWPGRTASSSGSVTDASPRSSARTSSRTRPSTELARTMTRRKPKRRKRNGRPGEPPPADRPGRPCPTTSWWAGRAAMPRCTMPPARATTTSSGLSCKAAPTSTR